MAKSDYTLLLIMLLCLALFIGVVAELALPIQPPFLAGGVVGKAPTVNVTIYGGEISSNKFGFGFQPNNLSSPGPTLQFKSTDVVNLTFVNAGHISHAFAITNGPRSAASVLFGATVGSGSHPLAPGTSGYVIFIPNMVSDQLYYICPIPGHAELFGMYGSVVVLAG